MFVDRIGGTLVEPDSDAVLDAAEEIAMGLREKGCNVARVKPRLEIPIGAAR